jgi:L-lysine exporter family protein LysE/ArgO
MDSTVAPPLAFPVFVQGLALGFGLIVAIGAQNAFVLRQGLRREHVGGVVLFCATADAVLIAAGVLGMAQALGQSKELARALAFAGAAFLAVYGWQALQRARQAHRLAASAAGSSLTLAGAMAQAAAFTLLNPHVYLDTVLLVGSIGAQQPAALRGWFIAGAAAASLAWFSLLGFGARWLAPWFARPRAWQVLDGLVGATMFVLSVLLVRHSKFKNGRTTPVHRSPELPDRSPDPVRADDVPPAGAWVCHGRSGLVANPGPQPAAAVHTAKELTGPGSRSGRGRCEAAPRALSP